MINRESWEGCIESLDGFKCLFDYFSESEYESGWIFRGQFIHWDLNTTLERACKDSGLTDANDGQKIEENLIREFERVYDGNDRDRVERDKLYALSIMRHYGAPTRLLDFTYSKYVGLYFALEYALDNKQQNKDRNCAIWCINTKWLSDATHKISPKITKLIRKRGEDETRDNDSFKRLYLNNKFDFVGWENPLRLHQRLHIQQGVFLCPGNVKKSFMENLKNLKGWNEKEAIKKVICRMSLEDLHRAINECKRMNISRESLFPGLDGFAQSMKYHLDFYKYTYEERIASI
ncbi:MAG: FRG domain-containing protein [Dehalococcoidia bacterium]|jgi:hypothetical protein